MPKLTRVDLDKEADRIMEGIQKSYGPPKRWIPKSNPASTCGHPCPFYLWAVRARPNDLPEPWPGLPRIFDEGNDSERKVRRKIEDAGYDITHDQVRFRDERLDITGLIDGYVSKKGSKVCGKPVPYETKGFSSNNFPDARSFSTMLQARYYRLRMAPAQILAYALMAPEDRPVVCFAARNKGLGEIHIFFEFVEEWWHVLEGVESVLTQVNDAMKSGTPPEPMLYESVWCDMCDAKDICPRMEALRGGGNIVAHISGEVDGLARSFVAMDPHRKEFDRAKRQLKKQLESWGAFNLKKNGEMRTVVLAEHRLTVTLKGGKKYMDVVPLEAGDEGKEEVAGG
jgi:hypothetical protein